MEMLSIYARVLRQLGVRRGLAWTLLLSNLTLAIAHFAEPILFGRVIDALARASSGTQTLALGELVPLIAAWVALEWSASVEASQSRFTRTCCHIGFDSPR
jgi:hypothetical protein